MPYQGYGAWSAPVYVYGGRFAFTAESLNQSQGKVVEWARTGPLLIQGMNFCGSPGDYGNDGAKLWFEPQTVEGGLIEVRNNVFSCNFTETSEPIHINTHTRISTSGNLCGVAPCTGIAGGISMAGNITQAAMDELSEIPMPDGHVTFCTDCKPNTKPCDDEGTGSIAVLADGGWDCGGGVLLSTDTGVTRDNEWDTAAEINSSTTDDDFATLTGTQTLTNKTLTASSNAFPALGLLSFTGPPTTSGTRYFAPGGAADATEANVQLLMPAVTVKTLVCSTSPVLTGSATRTVDLRRNATNQLSSCTLNSSTPHCSVSGTSTFNGSSDLLSLSVQATGSFSSRVSCTATAGF